MDLKFLSILITALTNFLLGAYVLFKNPKRVINISFSFFLFSAALWSMALFIIGIGKDYQLLRFAGHFSFFSGALMPCNFLLFALVFPQAKEEVPPLKVLLAIYLPGAAMAVAAFTPFFMTDITPVGSIVRPVYGKGILVYTFYCVAYTGYGLFLLARKYMKNPGHFEKMQLKYIFWGLLISTCGVVLFALVLPIAGVSRYSTPLTPLVTIIAISGMSYAIVRHRLMDLGVVFRSVLIYSISSAVMTVLLIGLLLLLAQVLAFSLSATIFFVAIFAVALVQPIRQCAETIVDRYYLRGRYNYKKALTEFSHSMTKILDLEDLQNRIVHEVASILQVKTAALLLSEPAEKKYTVRASIPVELADSNGEIGTDKAIIARMNKERTLLVKEELKRSLPRSEFEPLEKEFEHMDAEVFIPLIYRDELIGVLSLGEKISTDIYSVEDANLLITLGNQAAVALENALLHHTVTMLKNHNENILKYMSSGVIAIDQNQKITTCNDKAREILRLSSHAVVNKRIDILPPTLREMLASTLSGKSRFSNQEVQILSQSGAISYLSASTSLIKNEKDGITGALLVVNDLTEIRILEGEMWRADKLASLGTLAAGMAHEIKNPLVSIKTFAQLLPTRYEDKEFRDKFASITVNEVERINSIVEKLLEFARPSAPLFDTADIIEIIEEVLLLLSTETTKLGVTVIKNYEVPSAPIICDKSQFKQALLNLCLNGLQAIENSKASRARELELTVALRKKSPGFKTNAPSGRVARLFYEKEAAASMTDAEAVIIKVRDSGRGIGREDLTKIFDPFFTTREKGLGLGLAVVHGIIKEHSGSISVDSKKNYGTEFVISLPVTQLFAKERA